MENKSGKSKEKKMYMFRAKRIQFHKYIHISLLANPLTTNSSQQKFPNVPHFHFIQRQINPHFFFNVVSLPFEFIYWLRIYYGTNTKRDF